MWVLIILIFILFLLIREHNRKFEGFHNHQVNCGTYCQNQANYGYKYFDELADNKPNLHNTHSKLTFDPSFDSFSTYCNLPGGDCTMGKGHCTCKLPGGCGWHPNIDHYQRRWKGYGSSVPCQDMLHTY